MSTRKVAVMSVWMAAACFGADPPFQVVIYDYAATQGAVLQIAGETARKAFHRAGLESDWSVCRVSTDPGEHCVLPLGGTFLEVKVVPSGSGLVGGEALGLALTVRDQRSVVSYAFYEPATALAEHAGQSISVVLAFVMAHEIGHLMGMRHSSFGIMKPKFERTDLLNASAGRLNFTTEDAKALRSAARVLGRLAQISPRD